jgi:LysR family carnitine catabolism transcriptional activator
MINPPLRHVVTFVCLSETQSFRRAAERLGLSQPAVSAHIRDLERAFGVPLVHRTTRHVSLTPEGQAFAARARRALDEIDMASQDLRDVAAIHRGRVVVACMPPMMTVLVPNVVRTIHEKYPTLEVEILDVLSGQVVQHVARGDVDFGIAPRPMTGDLSFTLLHRDHYVAAVPQGHPLAGRKAITIDELTAYPIVAMKRDSNARRMLDAAMSRRGLTLRPRFEVLHLFSVGRMVEADLGVTALPLSAVSSLASTRIATIEIKSPRVFREIGLIKRREYQYSPAAQTFVSILKNLMETNGSRKTGLRA